MTTELKFYKAEDGDYDLEPGRGGGYGICSDGLAKHTELTISQQPKVLYVKFLKRRQKDAFEIVPLLRYSAELLDSYGEPIALYGQLSNRAREAYDAGYRYLIFQMDVPVMSRNESSADDGGLETDGQSTTD